MSEQFNEDFLMTNELFEIEIKKEYYIWDYMQTRVQQYISLYSRAHGVNIIGVGSLSF